ncbi:MAG: DNA-directed RNA polymerase subunit omega [Nitrospirae bacterium]|nr:DNA-directed RNA polymerase subunit omega [Nitrospirota bacterium]MBI3352561.1 DNA-directed RNA polymerase subunit omega [Nitrospirota bacterium]
MLDIISLPIVIENKKIDSRHRLVIIAAQRAKQIIEAPTAPIDTRYEKATSVSVEEILENKVVFFTGKEARQAQKEAKRVREEEMKTQAMIAKEGEMVTEIKKDLSVYVDDSLVKEPEGD